ncbi:MAG: hypothetical protein MUD12_14555 [Spirochaetes bacterium]|jgi:hypothetical protein|nr:hypothetical protein [Spirochaetota bacterium]
MAKNSDDIKKIERKAISLMMSREIPAEKMKVVRSLMKNENLHSEERYSAIIELIKSCPERKVNLSKPPESVSKKDDVKSKSITKKGRDEEQAEPVTEVPIPTDTSLYIDEIYRRYRRLKLFKKRRLVLRNNRFGYGLRKRLMPSGILIRIMKYVADMQEYLMARLPDILNQILNDEGIQDPTEFNYLRIFRKWMMDTPLVKFKIGTLKWMERHNYEREFKSYIMNYFSFLLMDPETRERVLIQAETALRSLTDLRKEEVYQFDSENEKRGKEKRNLAREKDVYDYILILRSFLPANTKDDSELSKRLRSGFRINGFTDLLLIFTEGLIFQRKFRMDELQTYFNITPHKVSGEIWDYSVDALRKLGKDPESRKQRVIDKLKNDLVPYEFVYRMLAYESSGENILMKSAQDQWRLVDRKHYDAKSVYAENFFNFIDAVLQYFKNCYRHILDGSILYFIDADRTEMAGSIFSKNFFAENFSALNSLMDEMHFFRSKNPTLSITRDEVKKIMNGHINTMTHAERFMRGVGDFFYFLGKRIQSVYDLHRLWVYNGGRTVSKDRFRKPVLIEDLEIYRDTGMPCPYSDCTLAGAESQNPLIKEIYGSRVLDGKSSSGIIIDLIAFCFQASFECFNERISGDLDQRTGILKKIEDLK